jgi:lipid-A-disaccharide synthase
LLAPGSRAKEVNGLLQVFDAAARRLQLLLRAQGEECSIVIAAAENLDDALYKKHSDFPLIRGAYRQLCSRAHLAMITSGTATLEAALLGLPHVACYQSDPATAAIGRHLVQSPHLALPNSIHARRVIPELLQKELTPERLSLHALGLWEGKRREQCLETLGTTAEKLGGTGAMQKLAALVSEELDR